VALAKAGVLDKYDVRLIGNLKGPISFVAAPNSVDGAAWMEFHTARDSWYPNDYVRLAGFVLESSLSDGEHTIALRTIVDSGHVFRLFRLMVG
jgi:hypothetical protein